MLHSLHWIDENKILFDKTIDPVAVCIKVSDTEPLFKLLTNTSAKPFPLSVSITAGLSDAECKILRLSKFV